MSIEVTDALAKAVHQNYWRAIGNGDNVGADAMKAALTDAISATPPAQAAEAVAEAMGAKGAPSSEPERLAFEAWMRGHCWALCATWDGKGYRSDAEQGGGYCPHASMTRRLWAAWRDRAAIAAMQAGEGK